MAKTDTSKSHPPPPATETGKEIPFEKAIAEIEGIVEELEGDDVSLAVLLEKYEVGIRSIKACEQQLEAARQKISTLEAAKDGSPTLTPFAGSGEDSPTDS